MSMGSIHIEEKPDRRNGGSKKFVSSTIAKAAVNNIVGKGISVNRQKSDRFAETPIPTYLQPQKEKFVKEKRRTQRQASCEMLENGRNQQRLNNSTEVIKDNYLTKQRSQRGSSCGSYQEDHGPAETIVGRN